jgi:putative CocE/NonD family hydrolase
LKAVSPQAPVTDWFSGDDFHHNGAFFLADAFTFYSRFGVAHPKPIAKMPERMELEAGDLYEFFLKLGALVNAETAYFHGEIAFWKDLMTHGTLDDFWRARNPLSHYRNLKPAVLTVGGLFDAEDLFGTLATYHAIEKQSPGAENSVVLGPWAHGGWFHTDGESHGDLAFAAKTSHWYHTEVELPFFERHLRGRVLPRAAEATVFETGTNEWHRFEVWPPKGVQAATMYLSTGGKLAKTAPKQASTDSYVSDPAHPVPYTGSYALRRNREYMSEDQRFASRRTDVLSYVSEPVSTEVALAGPVEVDLWVSTTGTDADFVVKLVDIYPANAGASSAEPKRPMAGYEQLVRAEVMRGKFRDSLSTPKPFVPNQPTRVHFTLPDVSHAFRMGHRIAVQVQSSWFPLVDRNPQRFVDIYHATDADFHAETERVLVGGDKPSSIKVGVVRGALP